MSDLAQNPSAPLRARKCVPCEGGMPALGAEEIKSYLSELKEGWEVFEDKKIIKEFKFADFKEAVVFINKVAGIANHDDHHPDIAINYNKVTITLWTHAVGGLSENDFIVAAKIDKL